MFCPTQRFRPVLLALLSLCLVAFLMGAPTMLSAATITLESVKDNTLYENAGGLLSNGAGQYMFAGKTGSNAGFRLRRAVLAFDLSAIPAGSVVNAVSVSMFCSNVSINGPGAIGTPQPLHKLLSDWGEGTSDTAPAAGGGGAISTAGDATWIHTFFPDETWSTPGGDYEPINSSSVTVVSVGPYTWPSSPLLIADVQSWIDFPATNFGWIMLGSEAVDNSAKRFNTHEFPDQGQRPSMFISYTPGVPNATTSVGSKKAEFGTQER